MPIEQSQMDKIGGAIQSFAPGLQAFGAGLQGNLPQWQAVQNQQQQMQQIQQERQQRAAQEAAVARQQTVFMDANAALNLASEGNWDGVIGLGMQRLQLLQQFPDADPSDTQRLTKLAIAAKNGSEEAEKLLMDELKTTVDIGREIGILESPKAETLTSNQVINGQVVQRNPDGSIVATDVQGLVADATREREKDENGRWRYVDDGQLVFPEVEVVEEELSEEDRFTRAKTIRDEIAKKNDEFSKIANSWDRIAASADDPSAAGDLALIFNFMKMLDPGSTVREGEFATAQNSGSVPERVRAAFNKVQSGERLSQVQRSDFFGQAQNIFNASSERASQIEQEYLGLASRYGLKEEDVLIDRGAAPDVSGAIGAQDAAQYPTVNSKREYDALQPGALYLEDGVVYRKPQ